MACDCQKLTKSLLDIRKSLREEETAIDAYIERAHRAEENDLPGLAKVYDHIRPEESQHFRELVEAEASVAHAARTCQCPLVNILYPAVSHG